MSELNATPPSRAYFDEVVRPQCKDCTRPKLLREKVIELGIQRQDPDWQSARAAFAGYIALCPREAAPKADDKDSCIIMIEDRGCKFDELSCLTLLEAENKAEELLG